MSDLADGVARFEALVALVELPLRRALIAAYGPELGREAAADALAWAWEHLDQVSDMDHPGGYLWRVAQTSVRRQSRHNRFEVPGRAPGAERAASSAGQEWDDELLSSLRRLSEQQRVAILLVHAYGYTLAEAADALGCGVSSLRNHLQRGLRHVRADLEREPR